MKAYAQQDLTNGLTFDARESMYPSTLEVKTGQQDETGGLTDTTMGYVLTGEAEIRSNRGCASMRAGGYFSVAGRFFLDTRGATVILFRRYGFRGQYTVGEIEKTGRLTYIDGCSDSMLVYPPRLGDAVLNHLHFPEGIKQTQHTHPSIRLGVVARGEGTAWGPVKLGDYSACWEVPLTQGAIFMLDEQEMHSFKTDKGQSMDVIAFHPDSDWGPTDQAHPMFNRTYLGADALSTQPKK